MIVIVDYGMGNLNSVLYKVKKLGVDAIISSKPEDVLNADKLIMPGVGSFGKGMENLTQYGLVDALNEAVIQKKIPILGICLGMQLFTKKSEEGNVDGLGWVNAKTIKFRFNGLKVPHVGWNSLSGNSDNILTKNLLDNEFYFTHSYFVECEDTVDIISKTEYGYQFVSALQKGNIYGVQFHPEKSHRKGMKVIQNFLEES